jgi:Uma2 family endonuclease
MAALTVHVPAAPPEVKAGKAGKVASEPSDVVVSRDWAEPVTSAFRWSFTVAEYHQLQDAGVLGEDDRVELIGGDLVMMSPIGSKHAGYVNRLTRLLVQSTESRAVVAVQNPVHLDEYSEPQPDLVVLSPREDDYTRSHPMPEDVLLVIEVADTTADYDRDVKIRAYARAGIAEAWLIDLAAGWLEAYREPSSAGYKLLRKVLPGERVSPQAFPDIALAVSDIIR